MAQLILLVAASMAAATAFAFAQFSQFFSTPAMNIAGTTATNTAIEITNQ